MFRKHINSLENEDLNKVPFYSWNCLTLNLKNRDIDLVIRDDKDMDKILKFLVYKIQTVDGQRGSAINILKVLENQSIRKL